MKSMAAICSLSVALTCTAATLGLVLGHAQVWGWREIGENYGKFICVGLGLGSVATLPVMITGLVVSERRALVAVGLGGLAVGIVCCFVSWTICGSFARAELKGLERDRYIAITNQIFAIWETKEFMDAQLWLLHRLEETTWQLQPIPPISLRSPWFSS